MPTSKSAETPKAKKKKKTAKKKQTSSKADKPKAAGEEKKGGGTSEGLRGQSQSCHQCRQSIHSSKGISEVKSGKERLKCSTCTRFWCEQCLHNRYGVIKSEVVAASWTCPVCSKNCNCSLCRRKEGKLATGILTPLVKNAGYGNVSDFLDKGTDDIAKVLQWKSPDPSEAVRQGSGEHGTKQQTTDAPASGPSRKRKRRQSDVKISETLTSNTPTHQSPSSCHGDDLSCHGNRGPKRQKLNHSCYSITLDEDPTSLDVPRVAKVDAATVHNGQENEEPCNESFEEEEPQPESVFSTPERFCRRSTRPRVCPRRYGAGSRSARVNGSLSGEKISALLRRSPRTRTLPMKYAAEDFRKVSYNQISGEMKCLSPKSSQVEDVTMEEDGGCDLSKKKREELGSLKQMKFDAIRSTKIDEKERMREELKLRRQKALEERERLREEERMKRQAVRERLRMARSILKEAQRSSQKRKREREKECKKKQLQELKEKKAGEKRRMKKLCSAPAVGGAKLMGTTADSEEVVLVDDSPDSCVTTGVPPLPELPALDLGVSAEFVPRLLVVCELLASFASALKLKRKLNVVDLCAMLSGGRGLSEVYLALLRVVAEEDGSLRKELRPTKKQRDLEEVARQHLHRAGRNGFVTLKGEGPSLEESVIILEHLCQEALQSDVIVGYMDSARDRADKCRREHRTRERDRTKQISDELKQLCEGGCSLSDIEEKRRDFTKELAEMRTTAELEQSACSLALRNTPLGEDRYGRTFWHLQCFPGVLVEMGSGQEEGEAQSVNCWYVISNMELLGQFMESLHPQGRREKQLHGALDLRKTAILSSLTSSKQEMALKRFYGSR